MTMTTQSNSTELSLAYFSLVGLIWIGNEKLKRHARKRTPIQVVVGDVTSSGYNVQTFKFMNFQQLDSTKSASICTPSFTCFGQDWRIKIVPG